MNFPLSPTAGQQYTEGGRTWAYSALPAPGTWDLVPVSTSDATAAAAAAAQAVATALALNQYDGGTLLDVLDNAKVLATYAALRAYSGRAKSIRLTTSGVSGFFSLDTADTTTIDNGGTVIVDALNRRWKRVYDGVLSPEFFGAKGDGTTNDCPAWRLMYDAVATNGGVCRARSLAYYLPEKIYIPQRNVGVAGGGIRTELGAARITGNGSNTVFESGTGAFSTVAKGGASNWNLPAQGGGIQQETPATIHYNSVISGGSFFATGETIRLFNWIQGCGLRDANFTTFKTYLHTERCFYFSQDDIVARPLQIGRAATDPMLWMDDSNNTQSLKNVHLSGIAYPGGVATPTGVGIRLDRGVQGLVLGGGLSIEGTVTALELNSVVYSLSVCGVYFEANTTAIKSMPGTNVLHLVIDHGTEFEDNTTDIDVDNWTGGVLGAGARTEGIVKLGAGCTCVVETPAVQLTPATQGAARPLLPANWTIGAGCTVRRNTMIFDPDAGYGTVLNRWSEDVGADGRVPRHYGGKIGMTPNVIPGCVVTGIGTGTLVVTTSFLTQAGTPLSRVTFDFRIAHTTTQVLSGHYVFGQIFRSDSVAGPVITAIDNSGYLGFEISNLGITTSVVGDVHA